MYLAKNNIGGCDKFSIRKSVFHEDSSEYGYRQVFDLGSDPTRYVSYFGGDVLCFYEGLQDAVAKECSGDPDTVLEDLLFSFLSLDEQQKIRTFRRTSTPRLSPLSDQEKHEIDSFVHMFDRRRLYYIRYGAVDQSRIHGVKEKLYRPLLYKCRDEKECYFQQAEKSLKSSEFKKYVYVIFNLQLGFSESFSSHMPEALDQRKVEELFVEKLCRLNADASFWQGENHSWSLHHHLHHYLIKFLDYSYEGRSFQHDFYKSFRADHRKFRWPEPQELVSEKEIQETFCISSAELKKMDKRELARLFRKKAKEYHPDSGGESEKFILLRKAYDKIKQQNEM